VAPATTPTTTTPTPGAGTTPGHTPGGAAAAAALNFSWEAGVFSGLDLPLESALADFWGNETDQQTADRHRNEELALEQEHLPEMTRRRDARFAEIVEQAVDGKLRTYMAHGDPLPEGSPQAVLDLEDWQAAVEQVEREMPLHDFRAHNVLEASGFASLAAAAPTHAERTTQLEAARTERRNQARGTPGGAAAGAAAGGAAGGAAGAAAGGAPGGGAAGAAAGAASGGAAGAAGGAAAGAPAEAPVGATAAPAAEAAPVAAPVAEVPAAPAAAPAGHTGALEHIAEGGLVAALASGITSHAAGGHEMSPIDPVEIEFRPEMLERLVSELYPRLRSRLRTELLVDRERAGLLMDFR
jgi:hypothetical protein